MLYLHDGGGALCGGEEARLHRVLLVGRRGEGVGPGGREAAAAAGGAGAAAGGCAVRRAAVGRAEPAGRNVVTDLTVLLKSRLYHLTLLVFGTSTQIWIQLRDATRANLSRGRLARLPRSN